MFCLCCFLLPLYFINFVHEITLLCESIILRMNLNKLFHNICFLLSFILFGLMAASCDNRTDVPDPNPPVPVEASRTVLVYMLASNNGLGATFPRNYDIQDIQEMQQAAANGDLGDGRLLVYHSASNGNNVLKEVTPRGIDTLKVYDTDDLPQTSVRMNEVFDDMERFAPAHDYALVLWGHGTGWLQDGIIDDVPDASIFSYGSEQYDKWKMNITTLADVLGQRNFSFLYMDCCYMSSVEVIYQLRHAVPRIVAYPTEILAYGMPYDQNVKHFFTDTPGLVESAKNTFNFYNNLSDRRYRMCTVSVINTAGMDRLAIATRKIYEQNQIGLPSGYTPQPYSTNNPCYYFDFGSYVSALNAGDALVDEYKAALAEVVELELATDQIWGKLDINEHSGLSTFIMKSSGDAVRKNYNRLDWYIDVASALN